MIFFPKDTGIVKIHRAIVKTLTSKAPDAVVLNELELNLSYR